MQMGIYEPSWQQQPAFVPEEPLNDMRAITVNDDMSTMFPEPRDFSVTETPLVEKPQTWLLAAVAIGVLWFILRK
jgi:hypothetical protein